MSSIIYVHTHRFYSEVVTFFNNFNQLQNVMNRCSDTGSNNPMYDDDFQIPFGKDAIKCAKSNRQVTCMYVNRIGRRVYCLVFRFRAEDHVCNSDAEV
jgi:hypothetical protein